MKYHGFACLHIITFIVLVCGVLSSQNDAQRTEEKVNISVTPEQYEKIQSGALLLTQDDLNDIYKRGVKKGEERVETLGSFGDIVSIISTISELIEGEPYKPKQSLRAVKYQVKLLKYMKRQLRRDKITQTEFQALYETMANVKIE